MVKRVKSGRKGKKDFKARDVCEKYVYGVNLPCKVDNKGRMMLPSKFRDELGEQEFVITRGLDNCIDLFPIEEWKKI